MDETKLEKFEGRHLGLDEKSQSEILKILNHKTLDEFIAAVVPDEILDRSLPDNSLPIACSEVKALEELKVIAQ